MPLAYYHVMDTDMRDGTGVACQRRAHVLPDSDIVTKVLFQVRIDVA